jgi:hypothetical protein
MFENNVLRRKFGPEREREVGSGRLQNVAQQEDL